MIALDGRAHFGRSGFLRDFPGLRAGRLVRSIALVAAALVLITLLVSGFSENGFRLGSRLAWRYASLVFFAALVTGPAMRVAVRFFPAAPQNLSGQLVWGFCASYGIYLLSVFVPNVIALSAGATLMVLFGGGVALVMAATATPLKGAGEKPLMPEKIRHALLGTATAYFWLCYSVMALARIYGPHRPDAFYGFSLCLMILGLLARYADRWISYREEPASSRPASKSAIA